MVMVCKRVLSACLCLVRPGPPYGMVQAQAWRHKHDASQRLSRQVLGKTARKKHKVHCKQEHNIRLRHSFAQMRSRAQMCLGEVQHLGLLLCFLLLAL